MVARGVLDARGQVVAQGLEGGLLLLQEGAPLRVFLELGHRGAQFLGSLAFGGGHAVFADFFRLSCCLLGGFGGPGCLAGGIGS